MPKDPEIPHPQTSAPVEPVRTTEDPFPRDDAEERKPRREAGDASGERGDRMPRGADEPGAGL